MICRTYVGFHLTLLHTIYAGFRLSDFRDEDFFMFSYYRPMVDNDAPGAWLIWTPGARLTGFIKGITKHCYTQKIQANSENLCPPPRIFF